MSQAKPSPRRETIVAAARRCFVRFGYAKTSFTDVAKAAEISRPLIYVHFNSKDELLGAVFTAMFEERYPAVERILAAGGAPSAKLARIYEELLVEPWGEVTGGAAADEFLATCERIIPQAATAYEITPPSLHRCHSRRSRTRPDLRHVGGWSPRRSTIPGAAA